MLLFLTELQEVVEGWTPRAFVIRYHGGQPEFEVVEAPRRLRVPASGLVLLVGAGHGFQLARIVHRLLSCWLKSALLLGCRETHIASSRRLNCKKLGGMLPVRCGVEGEAEVVESRADVHGGFGNLRF